MTTKYGKVTITLKETAWKNDLKTITVVVQDADCILRHTAAVGAVVQRPLCGLSSGRN